MILEGFVGVSVCGIKWCKNLLIYSNYMLPSNYW